MLFLAGHMLWATSVMNDGGVPYQISNPAGGAYSTDFEKNVHGPVEHFDVYGTVQTKYSEVYWTRNAPIPLPDALVQRFRGKVMAITGYEIDQVTSPHAPPNSTQAPLSGFACYPDCGVGDKSVPIYHAYNHHYFSWLVGAGAEVVDLAEPTKYPNPTRTAFRTSRPHPRGYPTSIVFKENPGGEYRKSYHGYPAGYAQLIASPTRWVVEPMQIDTHNRNYGLTDEVGYQRWVLPAQVTNATQTEIEGDDAGWSPLLECPCTDRISRITSKTSRLLVGQSTCASERVASEAACVAAIAPLARVVSSSTTHDPRRPAGCLALPASEPGTAIALFNADASSTATCAPPATEASAALPLHGSALPLHGSAALVVGGASVDVLLTYDGNRSASFRLSGRASRRDLGEHLGASIRLSGPAGSWFGVGFGASSMADEPYALIVDGSGGVTERRVRPPPPPPVPATPRPPGPHPPSVPHRHVRASPPPRPADPDPLPSDVRALRGSWPTTGRARSWRAP